jgi:rod shape-determining protein MreD
MKRFLLILVLGLIGTLFQGALMRVGLPPFLVPQFLLLLVVFLAFSEVSVFGCMMAFVLGLLMDFSSAMLVGPWGGAFVAVYGFLAVLSHRLLIESTIAAMIITFVSVVGASLIFSLLGSEYSSMSWEYPTQVLGQAFVTALLGPRVLAFMTRRSRRRSSVGMGRTTALSAV